MFFRQFMSTKAAFAVVQRLMRLSRL